MTNIFIGNDWTDVLDARAAGMVPGFAAHGAPLATADVAPADRDDLGIEHFVAVQPPTGGDWRDQTIAQLEARVAELTGAPVDPRDRRIAELTAALDDIAAGKQVPADVLSPASDVAAAAPAPAPVGDTTTSSPPADTPPTELPAGATPHTSSDELEAMRANLAQMAEQLAEARAAAAQPTEAPTSTTEPPAGGATTGAY